MSHTTTFQSILGREDIDAVRREHLIARHEDCPQAKRLGNEHAAEGITLTGTALTPPLFLPFALVGAAALARDDRARGRLGAIVAAAIGAAFVAGSTANLPNDFGAARAAGTPPALTAVLAVTHLALGIALVRGAGPRALRRP